MAVRAFQVIARLNVGGAALHVMLLAARLDAPETPPPKSPYSEFREGDFKAADSHSPFQSKIVCGVVGENEADMRYIADDLNVPIQIIPELGREISLRGDLLTLIKLVRLFRREKPLIVHTHTAKAGFVGRVAARLAGVPVVLHTFHGHVFQGYFGKRKTQVFILLERLCAWLSDGVIVLSGELKRQITEEYRICRPDKAIILEIGFDLRPFADFRRSESSFRRDYGIPEDAPLIGIVGRLVPIKNHDLFIRAAAKVQGVRPAVRFVLIGDGERRAEIEALIAQLGLTDSVTLASWIIETKPVYAALDALVLSSKNEGVPVSIIEAMAARVPVVSTDVGGVRDLIRDSTFGAVVPVDDGDAMAGAILRALDRDGFDLDAAQRHVFATYEIGEVARKHAELYTRLLTAKGYHVR